MKRIIIALVFVAFSSYFVSCSKVHCLTPSVGIALSSADSIPDTIENVIQYEKGSGFTRIVDSLKNIPLIVGFFPHSKYIVLDTSRNQIINVYSYDWIITLSPSGKIYKLTNFSHTNDHYENFGVVKDNCVNSVSCVINDSTYKISPESTNSSSASTTLFVKY